MNHPMSNKPGYITLSDGTVLMLKIFIIDIKELGFSPFGGVNFDIKVTGGISTKQIPEDLKKKITDRTIAPMNVESIQDGWEIIDICKQELAEVEEEFESSKGPFLIKVVAEATMAARNIKYRTVHNEPIYILSWVWKISWRPKNH